MRNGSGVATQGVKIHVVKRDGEEASNHLLLLAKIMTLTWKCLPPKKRPAAYSLSQLKGTYCMNYDSKIAMDSNWKRKVFWNRVLAIRDK